MRRTSIPGLVAICVGVAAVSWPALRVLESYGVYLPPVSWVVDAAIVALAAVVWWFGWTVRAYQKGTRPSLDGIRAARTVVLAKAAALTGALLAGWYVAQVLLVLPELAVEPRRDRAIAAGIATLCAIGLCVVGLVVERFCQIPPSDGEAGETNSSAATA